ncbi:hypothetical protein [Saccharothrix sp. NRRL B-16348]|uniref:hypothetical protein n=1 Tax=Saccharothrix sp. NRRL B-16348 TaxID=1415542 RepID=UPI0012F96C04|nr:hypothetical protein [Saccharothrix sp. NRRL B-16348]
MANGGTWGPLIRTVRITLGISPPSLWDVTTSPVAGRPTASSLSSRRWARVVARHAPIPIGTRNSDRAPPTYSWSDSVPPSK